MKKLFLTLIITVIYPAMVIYAGGQKDANTVSMEKAIADATEELSTSVSSKTEIVIAAIKAPDNKVDDFLTAELTASLVRSGKFTILERGDALKAVDAEHEFQLSGMVSDKSAVGIGHYLGAKVVVTGTFDLYNDFNQLRLRAVDVRTSQLLAMPSSRINPKDKIIANVIPKNAKTQKIQVQTLDHLTQGKDLYREGKYDEALNELDEAIRREPRNALAYVTRANIYQYGKKDYNAAIADYDEAISLDGTNPEWYISRAFAYSWGLKDVDKAIDLLTQAIKILPNSAELYLYLGEHYRPRLEWNQSKNYYDQILSYYNQAIKLNPNLLDAYSFRADIYSLHLKNYDLAIADYTQVIRRAHKERDLFELYTAYSQRGFIYYIHKKDYDKAIADYTEAIRLVPNDRRYTGWTQHFNLGQYNKYLGDAYNAKGDNDRARAAYDNAIKEYEVALKLDPVDQYGSAKNGLEEARRARQAQRR